MESVHRKEAKMNFYKALVINDLHFPWENARAIELALRVGDELKPDIIVVNGDLMDCWEISHFVKNPRHASKANLKAEILTARGFLRDLRNRFPKARIIYTFGNHEFRWAVYISKQAKELFGLKGMTLEEQLECREQNIEVVDSGNKENVWRWGKLLIGHFDRVNKHSGYTAKNLLEDKSISLIQAHTHRGGSSFRRLYDRDIVAYENFCLCDRNPQYVDHPNWQLGYSIVYRDKKSDFFYVEPHPIVEVGRKLLTFFNGKFFEG